jgi:hypothetical protein
VKLGKRTPHPPDHRHHSVLFGAFLGADLPAAPASCDWTPPVNDAWELGENDEIGDCACVAPANTVICLSANTDAPKRLPLATILAAYKAFGGWDGTPGDASDGGCVISDVLEGWATAGIGGDKIAAFAQVDHTNLDEIKRAVALLGVCIIGVQLPLAAQAWGTDPWPSVDGGLVGDLAPGSWGGHCTVVVKYDATGAWIVTWGKLVFVPWPTLTAYIDEAWAVADADFVSCNGLAPNGLDLAKMTADCAAMRAAR